MDLFTNKSANQIQSRGFQDLILNFITNKKFNGSSSGGGRKNQIRKS